MRSISAIYTDEQATTLRAAVTQIRLADAAMAAAQISRDRALAAAGAVAREVAAAQRSSVRVHDMVLRGIAAEIAAATKASDRTIQRQIGQAITVIEDFPVSSAAREAGAISARHLRDIVDAAAPLPPDERGEYDVLAAAEATLDTPGRVRPRLLRLVARLHPLTPTQRHRAAREERCVKVFPLADGMSELIAVLPTPLAVAVHDRLVQMGRAVIDARSPAGRESKTAVPDAGRDGPWSRVVGRIDDGAGAGGDDGASVDVRTAAQIHADVLTDLLLTGAPMADPTSARDGGGTLGSIRAKIQITVPALTAIDPSRERHDPAELVGHGPIDAETARRIAAATPTSWDRVITHPVTGAVLTTDTYERTTAIDRHVRARDRHCRWMGCVLPAIRCEIDHTVEWARGGRTATENLSCLCQRHHSMKQFAGWTVRQLDGGILEWTSPLGAIYTDRPPAYASAVQFTEDAPSTGRGSDGIGDEDRAPNPPPPSPEAPF